MLEVIIYLATHNQVNICTFKALYKTRMLSFKWLLMNWCIYTVKNTSIFY